MPTHKSRRGIFASICCTNLETSKSGYLFRIARFWNHSAMTRLAADRQGGPALHGSGPLASLRHPPADIRASWRGGRVVEGARLESVYGGNSIAGSNPAPSAKLLFLPNS